MIEPTDAAMAPAEHIVRNRDDLVELLRARKAQIGLSNAYVEHALHMGAGGCDKLLGPSRTKGLSLLVAFDLVELFGGRLVFQVDPDTEARIGKRWERRDEAQVRRCSRVSMRLVEACRPTVLRELTSRAGKARLTKMTAAARKRIAKLAAKARWSRRKTRRRGRAA
jgi:hypothetical protein